MEFYTCNLDKNSQYCCKVYVKTRNVFYCIYYSAIDVFDILICCIDLIPLL